MPRLLRHLLLAAALLAPAAAHAQDAPAADGQIVVTGVRPDKAAIQSFVDATVPRLPGQDQLARFHWAICPVAAGMLPEQAAAVAKRIRSVARAAHIDVADEGCAPNLFVIVTSDKPGFLAALAKSRPEYFGGLSREQRRALADPANPVAAWHLAGAPLDAAGQPLDYDADGGFYVNRTTRPPSRIAFAARPQFAAAIVVIDARALDGLTTIQLADYAAMRTLVASDPARLGDTPAPTILRIIGAPMGSEIPLTLTSWDLGVLKSFYASDPKVSAASQRSDVRRRLASELGGEGARN
ncbi:hypothetical protein OF829_04900 [Sphingomonas sp. LB-2]|uniref:hypothetical protein n=1 Tax=Sphingomonas caeni TaxID=2984949 RepID=UPI00222E6BB2|nr:hypothetical protein [Sphingomonas caeni]MCW3846567.1 hypothetical protein [Sphingomonas caeni]